MAHAAFIVGDWGTSRLRLYLCDASNNVLETRAGAGAAAARGEHERVLDAALADWERAGWQGAAALPVVLCGMVGSSIGWVQAPYLPAPADPAAVALACMSLRGGRVRIVPGVSCRNRCAAPDVMRGEETQILGAMRLDPELRRGVRLLCLPGTHTKWVVLEEGAIAGFLTAPAGEVFELLSTHSVMVRDGDGERVLNDAAFESGLARVRDLPGIELLHRIFEVRSRRLTGEMPADDAPGYMSGLLVGSDVAGAARIFAAEIGAAPVCLIGAPELVRAYSKAMRAFAITARSIDGGAASLAGLCHIHHLSESADEQRAAG